MGKKKKIKRLTVQLQEATRQSREFGRSIEREQRRRRFAEIEAEKIRERYEHEDVH